MPFTFPKIAIKYALWLHVPYRDREFPTTDKWCEANGVSINMPANWRKQPGWQEFYNKAGLLWVEKDNGEILGNARNIAKRTTDLKEIAEYERWIYPIAVTARNSGYFDDLEPDANAENYLPEEVVARELDALPPEYQVKFIELITKLGFIRDNQPIIENTGIDIFDGLVKQVEGPPPMLIQNKKTGRLGRPKQLAAPRSSTSKGARRAYSNKSKSKNVEL